MKPDNLHNEDFLKSLKGTSKNPFKTPDNYLDNISHKIVVNSIEKNLPKTDGFITSENYFDTFKTPLSQELKTGFVIPNQYLDTFTVKKRKTALITLLPYASIAAVLMIGFFLFQNSTSNNLALNSDEIVNYLAMDDSVELDDLISTFSNPNTNSLTVSVDHLELSIEDVSLELDEMDIIDF